MNEKLAVEISRFHCHLDKLIKFSGQTKFTQKDLSILFKQVMNDQSAATRIERELLNDELRILKTHN